LEAIQFFDDLSCGSWESLVDTTLSIFEGVDLVVFVILDLNGDQVTTYSIYHTEIFIF